MSHVKIFEIRVAFIKILYFRKITDIQNDLLISEFVQKSIKSLREATSSQLIREIICLGIGRVSDCSIAKHQLAFISIIKEDLKIPVAKFYDPVLLSSDKDILEKLNFSVLSENKEGKYQVDHSTLFYLPHCPKQIINNLLFTNWKSERLKNITLICNSFNTIIESTPERLLRPNAHFLLEINPFATEVELENCYRFKDIFNDFSIHTFSADKLEALPSDFWSNHTEPHYFEEDLEFVKKNDFN